MSELRIAGLSRVLSAEQTRTHSPAKIPLRRSLSLALREESANSAVEPPPPYSQNRPGLRQCARDSGGDCPSSGSQRRRKTTYETPGARLSLYALNITLSAR